MFTLKFPISSDEQDDSFANMVQNQSKVNLICGNRTTSKLKPICQKAFNLQTRKIRFPSSNKSLLKRENTQRKQKQ